jgi:hypothetical protein
MRLFIIVTMLLLVACSTTVKGPVTGKQYQLDIGCTENMQAYERDREAVVGNKTDTTPPEVKIDCPTAPETQR